MKRCECGCKDFWRVEVEEHTYLAENDGECGTEVDPHNCNVLEVHYQCSGCALEFEDWDSIPNAPEDDTVMSYIHRSEEA